MWWIPLATAAIGAAGSYLGSKNTPRTTNETTQGQSQNYSMFSPIPEAMPGYGWLAQQLPLLMQQRQQYYPGQTYASPSAYTKQGVDQQIAAANAMQGTLGTAGGNYNFLSNAADVANNPYVQGQLASNRDQIMTSLQRDVLPALQQQGVGVNALGSDRFGIAQGLATSEATRNLANTNASTMLNAYGQGLGAQQSALGQTGNMLANMLAPAQTYLGAGQNIEGYQQKEIDEQMARWNFAQQEPWQRIGNIGGLLNMLAPLGVQQGTGSTWMSGTSPNPNWQSPWAALLGGGMAGFGAGNSFMDWFNKK